MNVLTAPSYPHAHTHTHPRLALTFPATGLKINTMYWQYICVKAGVEGKIALQRQDTQEKKLKCYHDQHKVPQWDPKKIRPLFLVLFSGIKGPNSRPVLLNRVPHLNWRKSHFLDRKKLSTFTFKIWTNKGFKIFLCFAWFRLVGFSTIYSKAAGQNSNHTRWNFQPLVRFLTNGLKSNHFGQIWPLSLVCLDVTVNCCENPKKQRFVDAWTWVWFSQLPNDT